MAQRCENTNRAGKADLGSQKGYYTVKKAFVQNSNYVRFVEAVKAVEQRGAREASFLLVAGRPGLGKSESVDRFAMDTDAIYLRTKETWTKRGLLAEMADTLRLSNSGRNQKVQARIIGHIAARQTPIVIDEADFTVRSTASILECVRDISDLTEVLVGMETKGGHIELESRIARYPQISSRVAQVVRFQPLTEQDVKLTALQLAEVKIGDDVVAELHRQSEGSMRLVMNGLATIERLARANGLDQVRAEHIRDVTLCLDWQGRRARTSGRAV